MRTSSLKEKTSSRRKHNIRRRIIAAVGIGLAVVVFSIVLNKGIGSVVSYVTKPAHLARIWLVESSGAVPSYLRERGILIKEYDALKQELATHEGDKATIARLSYEIESLRALLGSTSTERIVAGVLARPNATPYDTILIDRGWQHGIKERAVVYVNSGIPIGIISKVYPGSALTTLFTTPGVRSTAYIYGPDIYTTTEGMGGGVMRVSVPQGITLSVGNPVILPSVGSGTYGLITHIESTESSPEQYGFLTTPVSISTLRFVTVSRDALGEVSFEDAQKVVEDTRLELLRIDVPAEILVGTSTPTTTPDISGATTPSNGIEEPEGLSF